MKKVYTKVNKNSEATELHKPWKKVFKQGQ